LLLDTAVTRAAARHNRHNPDFRFSLPILLNWYRQRIRYYPHLASRMLRTVRYFVDVDRDKRGCGTR